MIPLQPSRGRGNEELTRAMIRYAATSTDVRKDKTLNILNQFNYNTSDVVRGFGLSVDSKFAEIAARILNAPSLQYHSSTVRVSRGQWRNEKFISTRDQFKWGVLCFDNRPDQRLVETLCSMVIKKCPFFFQINL